MEANKPHNTATAYRRQRQIEDCLLENMQHTPYQSISVSDLCRQIGISRKAFYNYYHDKDACLCGIIDRVTRDGMILVTTAVPDNATPLEVTTAYMEYWKKQKTFWDVIVHNDLIHFALIQNINYVLREEKTFLDVLSTPEVKSDTDILACYMSIQITLLLQWYLRNFDTSAEEMARKFLRLMHSPLIVPPAE